MALTRLHVHHVRNLQQAGISSLSRVNVFCGPNGSGKTSLLEAVHLLGMARSFRGSSIRSLINHEEQECTVFGSVATASRAHTDLGVQRGRGGEIQIKVAGSAVRTVAELVEYLPLQVINADSFELLTGSPGTRRRFLDWGVFHVEHHFFSEWQRFQRCIKQRNKLLRRGNITDQELAVWTREFIAAGDAINGYRLAYFKQLAPRFQAMVERLIPSLEPMELRFRQGWDRQADLATALDNSAVSDRDQGFTHVGPQRADIRVMVGRHLAADTLSRGQQKLVVCALKLAQGQLMSELGRGSCVYLVDDLPSELDQQHSRLVCELLSSLEAQVFITCVEQTDIRGVWPESDELAMFHVEHGEIRPE